MSKKKRKFTITDGGMYDQKRNEEIANHLESYIDAIENLFILEGKSKEEVKNAIKVIKKAIKHLREGKPEKVFDEERFEEVIGF